MEEFRYRLPIRYYRKVKIAVDQVVPALTVGVAHLGVAVAGQIHKIAVVHRIEIDGGRFAPTGVLSC